MLHDAAYNGDLEAVTLFISHGADIHARDLEGETPLHKAALFRNGEMVDYLVSQGANLHAPSKRGETPQDFLDEPDNVEPILLSGNDTHPLALIVTDGLTTRMRLQVEPINYDTLWFPSASDVEGLDLSLKKWLQNPLHTEGVYIAADYILSTFDQYRQEYAGFVKGGARYIFCNMVHTPTDSPSRSPLRNAFTGILDGGCAQVVAIFEWQSKNVVAVRCNSI